MSQEKKTICQQCGKEFEAKRNYKKYQAKFCSRKCFGLWQSKNRIKDKAAHWRGGKIKKNCLICNKEFEIIPAKKETKFCSYQCYWQSLQGKKRKPLSEETKKKIGLANDRKIKVNCGYCGKEIKKHRYLKSKRYFCSRKCQGQFYSELLPKEETSNWQGGINDKRDTERKTREIKKWKKGILRKQNWTCQKCNKRGGSLEVHHIENFSKNENKRALLENGIVFCKKCHTKFHKKFGYKNNTQEQINQFIDRRL